jgi:parvulin-like peptidyl-prolyl isomerase
MCFNQTNRRSRKMRNWFVKHEKIISIVIVALFVVGIVWWSIAAYISSQPTGSGTSVSRENAVAVLTKDSTELSYPYWVMSDELDKAYQSQSQQYYQYYGQEIDPVFDSLSFKISIIDDLMDQKIARYYAEHNKLLPSKKDIEKELNKQVDDYLNQLKENKTNWEQIIKYYGSEKQVRDILVNSIKDSIEIKLVVDRITAKVVAVTKEEAIDYITKNFEQLKTQYEEVKAQHILVTDEATANKIKADILSGNISFDDAAAKFSIDTSNSTSSGELGWFKHGTMVQEFEDASFNATVNELIGPVQSQFGSHLIKVEDKKVFSTPEDVLKYPDIYSQIENTLKQEKFKTWFETYKADQKFGKVYVDKAISLAARLNSSVEDKTALEELLNDLSIDVVDSTGKALPDAKSELMAIFVNASNALSLIYDKNANDATAYITLVSSVDKNIVSMGIEKINEKINELTEKISKDTSNFTLTTEKLKYDDAKKYIELKEKFETMNLTDPNALAQYKKENETKSASITSQRTEVLKELFLQYPSSSRVVSEYYQVNPNDNQVKIQYTRIQLNQLKGYISYIGQENLMAYFSKQINDMLRNVATVVGATDSSVGTKLSALDLGLEIADTLGDKNLKIGYLEQIKAIDPNYITDIDKVIQDTKNATDVIN